MKRSVSSISLAVSFAAIMAATSLPFTADAADDHAHHGAQSEAVKAYNDAMAKMHEDMAITPSGNADIDFAKGMIPHHEGAVDMAKIVLKYGNDTELRKLAEDIIKAQEAEIAFMKAWLAKNAK